MELFVQYLDDLEDLIYAFALLAERILQATKFFVFVSVSVSFQILGIMLALASPPMAVAAASLLMVGMLYRGVVHNIPVAATA